MKNISIFIFSFVMVLAIGKAFASELVVMKITGDSRYSVGQVIQTSDTIEVMENSSLLLISSLGKKIQISGPFVGVVSQDTTSETSGDTKKAPGFGLNLNLVQSLARLFKTQVVDTSSLGAFRSVGEPMLSDPWTYDILKETSYCFQSPSELKLWRAKSSNTQNLTLRSQNDNVELSWEKGENYLSWPVDLPAVSAKEYSALFKDGQEVTFELHQTPSDFPTRIHTAAWMAEKKCNQQAMLLVVSSDVDRLLEGLAQDGKF